MFTDRVRLKLKAGKGGNGVVCWRREKYLPKGGPTGGNGGHGGSVVIKACSSTPSLEAFRNRRQLQADNGKQGGPNQRHGKTAKNLVLFVPCGTLIKDANTGQVLEDLLSDGQTVILCKGGRGGRGNASFKSSVNRAPATCTPGKLGESIEVELELKLIADVGLLGFPNAGKSSLITSLSRLRVRIAPYPFSTLRPNLGYVKSEKYSKILMADIPGIIEGAHKNKGLGFEFLRHIERSKVLAYVLDSSGIDGRNISHDYQVLVSELRAYNDELLQKPKIIILNKVDTAESMEQIQDFKNDFPDLPFIEASATEKIGLDAIRAAMEELVYPKQTDQSCEEPIVEDIII